MDKIEIIKLAPKRWGEYKGLRLRALKQDPQAFGTSYEETLKRPDDYWKERLQRVLENKSWILFASLNNQLVGMLSASVHEDEPDKVWLHAVYVDKDFRGKGIAKKLMTQMLEDLKLSQVAPVVKLGVNRSQIPAVDLYKGFGFEIKFEQDYVMGDGKIAKELIMEKVL